MPKLIITRGLPGSGKSSWAAAWQNEAPESRVVIGRDFIRLQVLCMDSTYGTHEQEQLVTAMQRGMVKDALLAGWDVCADDTNLPHKRCKEWAALARFNHAEIEVQDFTDVPLQVCVQRDKERKPPKHVGEQVIRDMSHRYLTGQREPLNLEPAPAQIIRQYLPYGGQLPQAWIFDIDGTCALMTGRGPFEEHRVHEDEVQGWVRRIAWAMETAQYKIVYLSGRSEKCRELTEGWLAEHGFPQGPLFMREAGDVRKDAIIKTELFWEHIAPAYNVVGVFDDRDAVVKMWREMGVPCAQVAYGAF